MSEKERERHTHIEIILVVCQDCREAGEEKRIILKHNVWEQANRESNRGG
jgi:hypothetical protein